MMGSLFQLPSCAGRRSCAPLAKTRMAKNHDRTTHLTSSRCPSARSFCSCHEFRTSTRDLPSRCHTTARSGARTTGTRPSSSTTTRRVPGFASTVAIAAAGRRAALCDRFVRRVRLLRERRVSVASRRLDLTSDPSRPVTALNPRARHASPGSRVHDRGSSRGARGGGARTDRHADATPRGRALIPPSEARRARGTSDLKSRHSRRCRRRPPRLLPLLPGRANRDARRRSSTTTARTPPRAGTAPASRRRRDRTASARTS